MIYLILKKRKRGLAIKDFTREGDANYLLTTAGFVSIFSLDNNIIDWLV